MHRNMLATLIFIFLSAPGHLSATPSLSEKDFTEGLAPGWNPCGNYPRKSTLELEKHLSAGISDPSHFQFQIDPNNAASEFGNGLSTEEFVQNGGFFGVNVKVPVALDNRGNPIIDERVIYDNKMTYQWSLDGKGKRLEPGKNYVHVIPQRVGTHQPEMLKWIKSGDIIVYWHPDYRDPRPDNLQQWRSTHAATVIEVPVPEHERDQAEEPCRLSTVDTPAGYARPFNGNSTMPFHVFRFVLRADDVHGRPDYSNPNRPRYRGFVDQHNYDVDDGKNYSEEINFWYRSQIARWGSLGFDQFRFNGNYDSLTVKHPSDINEFERAYLEQNFEESHNMYCAWYVFTNLSLAFMRPLTPFGLSQGLYDDFKGSTFSGFNTYEQELHRFGLGQFDDDYALPLDKIQRFKATLGDDVANVFRYRDQFAIEPVTAPELIANFLDRLLGHDFDVPDKAEPWVRHALVKAGFLTQMEDDLIDLFTLVADERLPSSTRIPDPEFVERYNQNVRCRFHQIKYLYQTSAKLITEEIAALVREGASNQRLGAQIRYRKEQIREIVWRLTYAERTSQRIPFPQSITTDFPGLSTCEQLPEGYFGRKWTPPYMYTRIAENYERNYLPKAMRNRYEPRLVYVGTVVHENFLRNQEIKAFPPTKEAPSDLDLDTIIARRLANKGVQIEDFESPTDALFEYLIGLADLGLNQHEATALRVLRNGWHWENDLNNGQGGVSEQNLTEHNLYGLDPILFRRALVNYWNDPSLLRPAIYDGDVPTLKSATENLRQLMLQEPWDEASESRMAPSPADPRQIFGHPRRSSPLPCVRGGRLPSPDANGHLRCLAE